ncbi:hypothetical protein, partial [Meiothermus hypogaeus]|uniref:hypothetical protein n=1 Tax=Meiothermus hypogaeus TaxID=884155 RepID=UPI001C99D8FD
ATRYEALQTFCLNLKGKISPPLQNPVSDICPSPAKLDYRGVRGFILLKKMIRRSSKFRPATDSISTWGLFFATQRFMSVLDFFRK